MYLYQNWYGKELNDNVFDAAGTLLLLEGGVPEGGGGRYKKVYSLFYLPPRPKGHPSFHEGGEFDAAGSLNSVKLCVTLW